MMGKTSEEAALAIAVFFLCSLKINHYRVILVAKSENLGDY